MTTGQERPRPKGITPQAGKALIGRQVTVTAATDSRGYVSEPQQFTGLVLALGRKFGTSANTRPYCLVLDARAARRGVPIIALRCIISIDPHTREEQQP